MNTLAIIGFIVGAGLLLKALIDQQVEIYRLYQERIELNKCDCHRITVTKPPGETATVQVYCGRCHRMRTY